MGALGEQLREAREAKGWTQLKASGRIGISSVHLCNLEGGHSTPSIKLLRQMAKLYRTTFTVGGK